MLRRDKLGFKTGAFSFSHARHGRLGTLFPAKQERGLKFDFGGFFGVYDNTKGFFRIFPTIRHRYHTSRYRKYPNKLWYFHAPQEQGGFYRLWRLGAFLLRGLLLRRIESVVLYRFSFCSCSICTRCRSISFLSSCSVGR